MCSMFAGDAAGSTTSAPQALDAEVAKYLATAPKRLALSSATLPTIRQQRASNPRPALANGIERTAIAVQSDSPISIRVYRPKNVSKPLPCVYIIHGGGFVAPSSSDPDAKFNEWCVGFPCVGVSIDYRLAPEAPYPAALNDCYAGLAWINQNADAMGIDRDRIGLFGASAGGGLAAALSLLARDRAEYQIAFQVLLYPMLDDRRLTPSSRWENVPVWPPKSNEFAWRAYLGDLFGAAEVPEYAAPARATDLTRLPPTYLMVGSSDIFLDEDVAFASRLSHAGVPTELHVYAGAPHGFDTAQCMASVSVRARHDVDTWLANHS